MKLVLKKIVLISMICFAWQASGHADTVWSGSPNPILDNGTIYYIDSGTVTQNIPLTIRGILEIRSGGTLDVDNTTVTIDGGTVEVTGGTLNNGKADGSGIINVTNSGLLMLTTGILYNGVDNIGTINLDNSTLTQLGGTFYNSEASTGYINVQNDSKVNLVGGTFINGEGVPTTGIINTYRSTVYVYNTIQNGNPPFDTGEIHLYHPGALIFLGGGIDNTSTGTVYIHSGGSLYNYYGDVEVAPGEVFLYESGKFTNVRGTHPGTFTQLDTAANFLDMVDISLDRDLDIDYTWTFTEKAVIKGNGHTINFGPDGRIEILGSTASLLLDDVIVSGLSESNIYCTDNNSTLSIHDVVWNQDNDVTFSYGNIYVSGDWFIRGDGNAFIYSSANIMTITTNATMHVTLGTLQYDSGTANKIRLESSSSKIHLENATLKAAQNCALTTGKLQVSGLGTLDGTATLNLEGLSLIEVDGSVHRIGTVVF